MKRKIVALMSVFMIIASTCITSFAGAQDLIDGNTAYNYLMNNTYATNIVRKVNNDMPTTFPAKFDLRNTGVVTPVKSQEPFGTCWGFAAIAAAESSILSKLNSSYAATNFDLSEHHLTYFSSLPIRMGSNQDGEGICTISGKYSMDLGGFTQTASSILASGTGVAYEAEFPYRGKNGIIDGEGLEASYSANDDWTIDNSQRFVHHFELIESNIIKPFVIYEDDAEDSSYQHFKGYDSTVISKMKKELMKGRPLATSYCTGSDEPGEKYYNEVTACQYDCDGKSSNHVVCIVGWDDSISKEMFYNHSAEEGRDGNPCYPIGDGAWIVKNSWGSENNTFPNYGTYGIKDENGKATGYFYLSYYDSSMDGAESLDFDVSQLDRVYNIDQYDFMPVDTVQPWVNDKQLPLDMANVFVAKMNQSLDGIGITTNSDKAKVNFKVYVLDENSVVPTDGELVVNEDDYFENSGYHKHNIKTPIDLSEGDKYAVVARVISDMGDGEYSILTINSGPNKQKAMKNKSDSYVVAKVNKGESFIYMEALKKWVDLADLIPFLKKDKEFKDLEMDNLPIKAFSTPIA